MQMDEEDLNDDILTDGDLGLDEQTRESFRKALADLKEPKQEETKSEFDPDRMIAAAKAAQAREEKWPKWLTLQRLLPALSSDREGTSETAEMQGLNDEIAELRAKLEKAQTPSGDAPELTEGTPP